MTTEPEPKDLGKCPKCGSTDRQSGQIKDSNRSSLRFETDTVRYVSDSGSIRGIVCNQCQHLELVVT